MAGALLQIFSYGVHAAVTYIRYTNTMKTRLFLICAALAIGIHMVTAQSDGNLHLFALNVGQGDAIFLRTPSGYNILIDGGPDNTVLSELGEVMPLFDRELDFVILTHPDRDHIGGLPAVIERFTVRAVVVSPIQKKSGLTEKFWHAVESKQIPVISAHPQHDIILDDGLTLDFLYPYESGAAGVSNGKVNNASVVAKVIYRETKVLLTGDIEIEAEHALIEGNRRGEIDVRADILKIAHHGSRTSSTDAFLKTVKPRLCLISAGKGNSFGHPHSDVLERLTKNCGEVARTDTDGRVEIIITPDGYRRRGV